MTACELSPVRDGAPVEPVLAGSVLSRGALRDLPDPEPLIDKTLDRGTVALLYGKWGTHKSFLALDWAACVATGKRWQSRDVQQQRVLYIAAEGAFGLDARLRAWESGWGQLIADTGQLDTLAEPVNLLRAAPVAHLVELIEARGYGLVVLDTLARCLVGGDENSAQDAGIAIDVMHRLRRATPQGRGVVLAVHHAGKDGKTLRGSSALESGADTVYLSVREEDTNLTVVERTKRKDGPQHDRHALRLEPIEGTGSAVLSRSVAADKPERADKLLAIFHQYFAHTGAKKTELREVAGMAHATFHRALSDLVESGDLVNSGTERVPFYKAVS
ncbi:Uncharacterised protein [Mycobacteroides abscessus subsp. massiliense]|uniref:AAA family ATPase n=1 Tax=Mycobacteroides abscessus TaxID=36809 RepID=UPI0009C4A46A|nr:AAA family ATPase [Mycobacteroides abscessus]SLH68895.1 Uncharacterised protein [Mycobacteroides abscessus subsp. massiliense]SLI88010.1 Uncharacterised protein [Mycobacteroides abscessus subsp. massiliense]